MAVAGGALIGGAASVAGSKKQADASKKGANLQMEMFNTLNRQQQPFIQSGYGALGKLNTLLGLGRRPMPLPGGGELMPRGPGMRIPTPVAGPSADGAGGNLRLKQILMLRAQNGDSEAARVLGGLQ